MKLLSNPDVVTSAEIWAVSVLVGSEAFAVVGAVFLAGSTMSGISSFGKWLPLLVTTAVAVGCGALMRHHAIRQTKVLDPDLRDGTDEKPAAALSGRSGETISPDKPQAPDKARVIMDRNMNMHFAEQ